jgi:hypothetical protein
LPDGQRLCLHTPTGHLVARLSAAAQDEWHPRLEAIEAIRVFAMVRRRKQDIRDPAFADKCVIDQWELPLVEVTYREDGRLR